ncbi:hypothetical protein EL26_13230 [Tumebacillus flagellatus]|uniref:Uncharacterized protein n=1 Tax=Tumebacillus flagellatus TaxID=1157490 RepID=A0A074LQU3_9BACL|nr:hypothetical protein EL26_13230 [Tumebacillus flagellatus]
MFHNLALFGKIGVALDAATEQMSRNMQDAWIAFTRSGNPDTPALSWPAYDTNRRATMVWNRESGVVDDPEAERRKMLVREIV